MANLPGSSQPSRIPSGPSQFSIDSDFAPKPRRYSTRMPHNAFGRWFHGFTRDPNASVGKKDRLEKDDSFFDLEEANIAIASSPLQRRLKARHLQMITIGGSVGTGLFVASGTNLNDGGPASVLIALIVIGIMLYSTVHALGEMAVLFPVAGSFSAFSTRFLDPAWGFAMGWNYALQWIVLLPLEIVSSSLTIDYWHSDISPAIWVTVFFGIVVILNLFGVRAYGEAEFFFSFVKVTAILGFIVLGVILDIGGGPEGSYIGVKYWQKPGAFHNGFKGLCSVMVSQAFAFAGTEMVGLAAAETANPRKTIPIAVKQVFWRITLFYIVALTIVGLLIPYDDIRLTQGESGVDAKASPFVIAIQNAGITGLDSVMNVVIMIAVLSVANSSVYGSSRTLAALAEQGQAPHCLAYIDRRGRPLIAIAVTCAIGLLGYLAVIKESQGEVFEWLVAVSGLATVMTWGTICFAHIRFRRGWKVQGHSVDDLAFTSQAGRVGSWLGLIINILILVGQFWVAVWPFGYEEMSSADRAVKWFKAYLAFPIVVLCYVPYKIIYRTSVICVEDMDLQTGRQDLDLDGLLAQERAERRAWPWYRKFYDFFC